MIIKVENTNPRITFLTTQGNRTPKEVWIDTETGVKQITRKEVISHNERLNRLGITPDMTDEETINQAKRYLKSINR